MTDTPDFKRVRKALVATQDTEVLKFVDVLDAIFDSDDEFNPRIETLAYEHELVAAIKEHFPTPFAQRFVEWAEHDDKLNEATTIADADLRGYVGLVIDCWKQIVHFLPLVLIAALSRIDDGVLQRGADQKQLEKALWKYEAFYVMDKEDTKENKEKQRESDQYELLVELLKLFRELSQKNLLNNSFVFAPLMQGQDAFRKLFPERFDKTMRLLYEVRNRNEHGDFIYRLRVQVFEEVKSVSTLIKWCLLEIITILKPLCCAFSVSWIEELRVDDVVCEAHTLDFVGHAGPKPGRYWVSKEVQHRDEYVFQPYRVYLIARDKRICVEPGEMLAAPDYLDLTPFLIVDRLRTSSGETDRLVFGLQKYFEPEQLLFTELGKTGDVTRPRDEQVTKDTEARRLLQLMSHFKDRFAHLTARGRRMSVAAVRSQLWRISKEHLATLMEVRQYDETGNTNSGFAKSELKPVYNPELFVEPSESESIASFVASASRGLLLVGDSGAGKSNLLVHHYLAHLRRGQMAAFLAGRRFDTDSFREILLSNLVAQVAENWKTLENLDTFLKKNKATLTIFIDAVNEYSGPKGPLSLLESLIVTAGVDKLRRCQIVASCRTETWRQYKSKVGRDDVLDRTIFFTPDGDAIRIARFDIERSRRLYDAYQRRYRLLPGSFDDLSEPVRSLIAQPLIMAMIAESYSNLDKANDGDAELVHDLDGAKSAQAPQGNASSQAQSYAEPPPTSAPHEIPADLDYFSVFEKLTERKRKDAEVLVPVTNIVYRTTMPEKIEEFCELLAEMIFERLMSKAVTLTSGRQALPIDALNKRRELVDFVQNLNCITVLEATLQIGLIEWTEISQRNRDGSLVTSKAFAFFHDQYTQYCLAAAYQQQRILGRLDQHRLANQVELDALIAKIDEIAAQAVHAPVLAGALDHWLRKNIKIFHDDRLEPVIPFLNMLAGHESAALRYQSSALVTNLILRGVFSPARAYDAISRADSVALRRELVNSFVDFWPMLQPLALKSFIIVCDRETLERLALVFVQHFNFEPNRVVDYLDSAIDPLGMISVTEPRRTVRKLVFVLFFALWSVFTCFDRPSALQALRGFFRSKLPVRSVLDLRNDAGSGLSLSQVVRRSVRPALNRVVDMLGWVSIPKFIEKVPGSGNDRYFVDNDGIVQRDVLAEFLPYVIDLHNNEFARLSLASGSPFRDLAVRMLCFRPNSVIGYNALLCMPSVLAQQDWNFIESFVMEVIGRRTPSAIFFGGMLLVNLSYSDKKHALPSLNLMRDRVIPLLLRERLDCDWSVSFCIAVLDVERLWPTFAEVLRQFFDHFEQIGDPKECEAFGNHLYKICYCQDILLAQRAISLLLSEQEQGRFLGPLWRTCTTKVLAAMLTRSPATLRGSLAASGIPSGLHESLMREARTYQSKDIIEQRQLFPYQVGINRFLAWTFIAKPFLRRAVVKQFIGSEALGKSTFDTVRGLRRLLLDVLNFYFGDHPEDAPQGRLSLEEIAASVKNR